MAASIALQVIVSPLLGTVFDNLASLIRSEFSLVSGVKKDLEKLSSTLSTIRSVIQDAEDKQMNDKPILDWLRKLKDAAYDAEDVIDECATEANLAPGAGSETIDEVHNKSLLSCFGFKRVIFRRAIGKRIKNLIERFDEIASERHKFHLSLSSLSNDVEARVNWRETSSYLIEPQVYGRDDEKENIVELLVSYNTDEGYAPQGGKLALSVCPILGMGGLGKTTLAQMVYNDQRIVNHFEVRGWVCVSENFDVKTLLRDIIISFGGKAQDLNKLDHLQNCLEGILSGKTFLLVLDDVWNEDESKWDKLKSSLACGGKGSSIIVTTRLSTTARIMGTLQTCCPKVLTAEECWSLVRHRAFGVDSQDPDECNPNLEAIGKEIARKCGGIPLAAKALGGLLRFKREVKDWLFVRDSKIWDLPQDKEEAILPALMLSYNHLPSNSKQCFAYCSIFPQDYQIEKDKLIQLWMANGFIQGNNGRVGIELEDIGGEIFDDLLRRSFFQEPEEDKYGNILSCKMHDLMHDLASSIMKNECSIVTDEEHRVGRRTRHLFLHSSFVSYLESVTNDNSDHLTLRSFLLMDTRAWYTPPPQRLSFQRLSFQRFETLRILDLNHLRIATVPISICQLKHLRYLDLSWTHIWSLPESICELKNLQTLRLTGASIRVLPEKMNEMTSLRHLYIGCDNLTASMPIGMGRMTCLRTLSKFIVGKESGRGISELQGLNHLRGELRIEGLDNVRGLIDAKSANLMRKEILRELDLWWSAKDGTYTANEVQVEEEEVILEQGLQPHQNIQSIVIGNYSGRKIPSWMMLLPNLVEVRLYDCRRCERLPPLGQLPLLRSLIIMYMHSLKCVGDEFCGDRGFLNLERLLIRKMPNLEKLWSSSSSSSLEEQVTLLFPKLKSLEIESMESLKCIGNERQIWGFPSLERLVINHTPNLEKLWFSCSSSTEQTTLFPKLKELKISIFPKLITCTPFPSSLSDLDLELKLVGFSRTSEAAELQSMTGMKILLQNLTCLKSLNFFDFRKLETLPVELLLQNLTQVDELEIVFCNDLVSLPNGFPNLISLDIHGCPEMEFLQNDLQHLVSLERLKISNCSKLTSLPEGLQNAAGTLQYLHINVCSGLTILPEWIGSFTALRTMKINCCVNLKCLPKGLKQLTSLKTLVISYCHPDLHRRCRNEKGEDWHKISHIPELKIIVDSDIYDTEKNVKSRLIPLPTCCSSSV